MLTHDLALIIELSLLHSTWEHTPGLGISLQFSAFNSSAKIIIVIVKMI